MGRHIANERVEPDLRGIFQQVGLDARAGVIKVRREEIEVVKRCGGI